MDCPVDGTTLMLSERQGVEIDYCPKCRGVWLDRGELDKIIERADDDDDDDRDDDRRERRPEAPPAAGYPPPPAGYPPTAYPPAGYPAKGHPKKRKRWLSEMFDFD